MSFRDLPPFYRPISHRSLATSCVLVLCVTSFLAFQLISRNMLGWASNWFVPDGITLATTFWRYWSGSLPDPSYLGSAALNFLYFPAIELGVLGFVAVNLLALGVTLKLSGLEGRLRDVLLPFPYFILALALPSKDVLTLAMTLLVVGCTVSRKHFAALAFALATFLVRDGAAVISVAFVVAALILTRFPSLRMWAVGACLVGPLVMDSLVRSWFGDFFIYARQVSVLQATLDPARSDLYEWGGAALRVIGNLTNLATRPSLTDEANGIALIGIAYWISGVMLLASAIQAFLFVWRNDNRAAFLAGVLFFVGVGVVSMSPLVQPRYLLPYAAIVMLIRFNMSSGAWRLISASAATSMLGAMAYMLSPVGMPPATTTTVWSPFWLF